MPEISVVIPSYNHAAYIQQAVKSVLSQTLEDLELVVIDDGSKDNSLEILRAVSDPRLRVIAQENQGAHAAINCGLRESRGSYLAILNSDDCYSPDRLKVLVDVLKQDPGIGMAGSYIEVIDTEGKSLAVKHGYRDLEPWLLPHQERSFRAKGDLRSVLMTENYWSTTSNYVFSREWYERIGEFKPLRYAHDWDFALRVSQQSRLYLHESPLMKYRVHASNTIRENQAAMIYEICWILAVHLPQQVKTPWFSQIASTDQVDQLLHSIHVFGIDRVLAVMMAQGLAANNDLSLALLNPDNPARAAYLDYIYTQLQEQEQRTAAGQPSENQPMPPAQRRPFLRRVLSRIKRYFR